MKAGWGAGSDSEQPPELRTRADVSSGRSGLVRPAGGMECCRQPGGLGWQQTRALMTRREGIFKDFWVSLGGDMGT